MRRHSYHKPSIQELDERFCGVGENKIWMALKIVSGRYRLFQRLTALELGWMGFNPAEYAGRRMPKFQEYEDWAFKFLAQHLWDLTRHQQPALKGTSDEKPS